MKGNTISQESLVNNGNSATMRRALLRLKELSKTVWESNGGEDVSSELAEMQDVINTALAEPPRNCEVGSVENQAERFCNFCAEHSNTKTGVCDPGCPCFACVDLCYCLCKWGQLPYNTKGEGDGR